MRDGDTQPIPVVDVGAAPSPRAGSGRHAAATPKRPWPVRIVREFAIIAALALVGLVAVRLVIGSTTYIPNDSMAPTLDAGQRVLVTAYPLTGGVGHGDVVIFEDTGNWYEGPAAEPSPGMQILSVLGFTSPAAGTQGVGRVVGMSGDRVECCDDAGRIKVNGQPLDERFLAGPTDQVPFDIRVPQGRIFVLGDARATALDSRSFLDAEAGTISLDDVTGRVLISVWPPTFVDGL